jgi:DNA-binding transcriptional LysR family regulator
MSLVNVDLNDARALIAMAESGSISRAACELSLTQPAVTRRIQRLEQTVGATLVDRRKRPFALTDAGEAAVERCRALVATAEELKSIGQGAGAPMREMRIGVAHALTEIALFESIEEMRRKFPALTLRLYTGWSRDLLARLKAGAVDVALIYLPEDDSPPAGVDGAVIAAEEVAIIAPRSWRNRKWAVRDLADASWVLNPEGCAARAWLQREMAKRGLPLRIGVEAYSYDLQLSLVARRQGLGLAPAHILARSASRSQLSAIPVAGLKRSLTSWLLSRDLSPTLAGPLQALRAAFARQRH